jgi:hypothetical protein
MKVQDGGLGSEHFLMVENGGYSEWVDEFAETTGTIIDVLKKMKVDFCLLHDDITYGKSELLDNKGEARLLNVIEPRTRAMHLRVAKTMERNFFSTPDANDDLTPWGLKYWIVKNATQGFNGSYASGFTRVGNVNLTDVPNFKNYTDVYTAVTKDDLIRKLRKAHRQTNFVSPRKDQGAMGDAQPAKRLILTNEDVIETIEEVGEGQNENLGRDLAKFTAGQSLPGMMKTAGDEITFKRNPIVYARWLDNDTTDPLYGLDMSTFHALTKKGDNMQLDAYEKHPTQKRMFIADFWHKHQTVCTNRRNNYVINKE